MDKTQVYTPHLKKVLKSYQAAATTSLHGPNSFMAAWSSGGGDRSGEAAPAVGTSSAKEKAIAVAKKAAAAAAAANTSSSSTLAKFGEYDPFLAPPPFKIQQPPIFTPADQSRCDRSETILEGETISCFVVGGEKRLCLPQILNTVLRDFCLAQINGVCDDLHIFCSRCNQEQLEVLKVTGILPLSAPSCGLITKTDAERLCSALLHSNPPRTTDSMAEKRPYSFRVYHECFGKCFGLCMPGWYSSAVTRCIECLECKGLFPPQKFVCHSHRVYENRTCHWGFDSANWRSYLLLAKGQDKTAEQHLDELKARFDYTHKYKRKQALTPSSTETSASPDTNESSGKRSRLSEEEVVPVGGSYPLPYGGGMLLDPTAMAFLGPWSRISAFKPWSPEPLKEGKPVFVPLPPHLADCLPPTVPIYLSASGQPLLLQHTDGHRFLHPPVADTKCGGMLWPAGVGMLPGGSPTSGGGFLARGVRTGPRGLLGMAEETVVCPGHTPGKSYGSCQSIARQAAQAAGGRQMHAQDQKPG